MPIVCRDFDLLFTHVPKTGGTFVQRVLIDRLGGELIHPKHDSFRRSRIVNPPTIRVFTVREPVSWYQSYWAYAHSSVRDSRAWPVWEGGYAGHPTRPLDQRCGHSDFAEFVRNALRVFPNGFLRSVYCDFLNGATHALRCEHLREDLATLLETVGYPDPSIVRTMDDAGPTEARWKRKANLPDRLERRLRTVENLDGLTIPYVSCV
jgi:hypothetical protein